MEPGSSGSSDGSEEHRRPRGEIKQLKSGLPGVAADEQIKTAIGYKKKLLEELQHQKKFANLYKVTNIVSEQVEEHLELQRETSASKGSKLRPDQETLRAETLQFHSVLTQHKSRTSGPEDADSEKKLLGLEVEMSTEMVVPYRRHRREIAALRSEKDTLDRKVEKLNHKLKKKEQEMAEMMKEIQELRQQNQVCVQLKVEVKEQTKEAVEPSADQESPHGSLEYAQVQRKKRPWWRRIPHFISAHKQ